MVTEVSVSMTIARVSASQPGPWLQKSEIVDIEKSVGHDCENLLSKGFLGATKDGKLQWLFNSTGEPDAGSVLGEMCPLCVIHGQICTEEQPGGQKETFEFYPAASGVFEGIFDLESSTWECLMIRGTFGIFHLEAGPAESRLSTPAKPIPYQMQSRKRAYEHISKDPIPVGGYLNLFQNGPFRKDRWTSHIIKCRDAEFHVHGNVLAHRSAVFSASFDFDGAFGGTAGRQAGETEIADALPEEVERFLLAVYDPENHLKKSQDAMTSLISLFGLAHKYEVQDIEEHCKEGLLKVDFTEGIMFQLLQFAWLFDLDAVMWRACQHSKKLPRNGLTEEQWQILQSDMPKLLMLIKTTNHAQDPPPPPDVPSPAAPEPPRRAGAAPERVNDLLQAAIARVQVAARGAPQPQVLLRRLELPRDAPAGIREELRELQRANEERRIRERIERHRQFIRARRLGERASPVLNRPDNYNNNA